MNITNENSEIWHIAWKIGLDLVGEPIVSYRMESEPVHPLPTYVFAIFSAHSLLWLVEFYDWLD